MPDYRRYRVPGGAYFFTVNLLECHANRLLVEHIGLLREVVRQTRKRWPFRTDAWVVLPEHLHCVKDTMELGTMGSDTIIFLSRPTQPL